MRYLLAILLILGFYSQNNNVYSQKTNNKKVKVESYFNMERSLGIIFCSKLNTLIFNAALQGDIPAYNTSNLKPNEKMDAEDIFKSVGWGYNDGHFSLSETESIDTIISSHDFRVEDVSGYYFSIDWQLDSNGYSYIGIPNAFSLAFMPYLSEPNIKSPIFWTSISDLKTLITPTEFNQLQEALFIHIYTNFYKFYYKMYPEKENLLINEDIEFYSPKKYFFMTRLDSDLDTMQLLDMNKKIYNDAINDKVIVYKNDSMTFGSIMTKEELKLKGQYELYNETQKLKLEDTIEVIPFNPDSIKYNSVTELWNMDYTNNKIIGQITGLSIDFDFIYQSYLIGRQSLFYVPYKYVESVIGKAELLKMSNILFNSLVKNYLDK